MNGVRADEILELLRALDEEGARSDSTPVLATIVSLDGSVYGRAGAMALLVSGAPSRSGVLELSDLEPEIQEQARQAAAQQKPRLCRFVLRDDGVLPSWGLGAPGEVELFLEPVDAALRGCLRELRDSLSRGQGLVCAVDLVGEQAGRRRLLRPDEPQAAECYREISPELIEQRIGGRVQRQLLCPIHPMGKVLIFGSSRDAAVLARHLFELGFSVFVGDPRPGRLRSADWDRRWGALIEGGWEQVRAAAGPDDETSIVVMTHSFALDLETLQGALVSPAPYVALPGSPKRTRHLLADLEALGIVPKPGRLFAPGGLDIGAEAPREAALSLAAEILALRSGRKGGSQSSKRALNQTAHLKGSVPGLVLAAGRGKRFSAGNKLSASIDGRPVLRHVVENALASKLDPVIVVLGCQAEDGLDALRGISDPRLRVVFNPRWEAGKGSTIEAGLREVPFMSAGVVSLLGDMPMVKPWLIDRVIAEFEISGRLVFPVYAGPQGQRKGYPTAFPRSLFAEMRDLTGDDTATAAALRHWSEAVKIALKDPSTQADVDTTADLELLAGLAQDDSEGLEGH